LIQNGASNELPAKLAAKGGERFAFVAGSPVFDTPEERWFHVPELELGRVEVGPLVKT